MPKIYNPTKLTAELSDAGLSTYGCDEYGTIFWPGDVEPDSADLALASSVLAAHNPDPDPDPMDQYTAAGVTPNKMLLALWNWTVNGKNETAAALEARVSNLKGG